MISPETAWRGAVGTLVIAAVLLAHGSAVAQVRVAILPPNLEGELTDALAEEIAEATASGFLSATVSIVTTEALQAAGAAPDCREGTCLQELASTLEADALATVSMSQLGQMYSTEMSLYSGRDGAVLGSASETCEVCTWAEAIESVARASRELAGRLRDSEVDAEPQESETVPDDDTAATDPPPEAAPPGEASPWRPMAIGGWVTGGLGAAALITGVLWLALEGHCALGSAEQDGICVDVYYTWPQGAAAAAVGVALLSVSVALLVVSRNRRLASASRISLYAGPAGFVRPGAAFGVLGRF